MSFISNYVAIQAEKIRSRFQRPSGHRIDENLPLRFQIGASVLFEDDIGFILADDVKHLVGKKPDTQAVVAYGRIPFFGGNLLHRFYLADGEHMIQVITNARNQLIPGEFRLYKQIREWFPQNKEEWGIWLHVNDDPDDLYRIGYKTFDLPDAVNTSLTYGSYWRMWPTPPDPSNIGGLAEQVTPFDLEETLNADPYGSDTIMVKHQAMLYGRGLEKPATFPVSTEAPEEWLLLCASEYPNGSLVQAHAGLIINPNDLLVVPSA